MSGRPFTSSRGAELARPLRDPIAILFDVDGTLISTGGAGTRSWRWAFEELHGIPADIGDHSEAGMTDPVVGRSTFRSVLRRDPTEAEMRSLLAAYLDRLPVEVRASERYRVLPGAEDLLRSLRAAGRVTGIVTGALEEASRIKLARGDLNRFLPFGGFGSDSADRIELTRRAIERGADLIGRELPHERVHVLGDTPRDMEAAVAVGAVAIGVTTGTYRAGALLDAGASVVVATLETYPAFGAYLLPMNQGGSTRSLTADEGRLWEELHLLVDSLPVDEVDRPGYFQEGWSAKDLIAHIGSWLAEAGVVLERIRFGTYHPEEVDIDAMNHAFYEAMHDVPFAVVRAQGVAARNRMLRAWRSLPEDSSEADRWIRKAGPDHYAEHLPRLREWVGELAR